VKAVTEQVKSQMRWEEAVSSFQREYAQEWADPVLQDFMRFYDAKLAESDPTMNPADRLKAVGEKARGLRGGTVTKPVAKPSEDKAARKASIRSITQASGRPYESPDDDDGDDSYESAIAKMAAARGQARPVSHKRN
jgi:hypothetical protein